MEAGRYDHPFAWMKRTAQGGGKDSFGQPADSFASQGTLWGSLDDLSGGRASAKESDGTKVTATVKVQNYPAVVAGDRLVDGQWSETWTVDSVARGDNELVLDVSRPRWTVGGGTV